MLETEIAIVLATRSFDFLPGYERDRFSGRRRASVRCMGEKACKGLVLCL